MGKILILEDQKNWQRLLSGKFGSPNREVVVSSNLKDATKKVKNEFFDLIIADLSLNSNDHCNRDGYEFLEINKKREFPVPAIGLSAYAREFEGSQLVDNGLVTKFVDKKNFGEAANKLVKYTDELLSKKKKRDKLPKEFKDKDLRSRQDFKLNRKLADCFEEHKIKLDDESLQHINEFKRHMGDGSDDDTPDNRVGMREQVLDDIFQLFTNLARRAQSASESRVQIGDNQRFNTEICDQLLWRLDIDPYDPKAFWDCLYQELRCVIKQEQPQEKWGKIISDATGVWLSIQRTPETQDKEPT